MDEIPVRYVSLQLCEACIDGIGEMCHTPGCALFLHKVDLPIHEELLTDADALTARVRELEEQLTKLDGLNTLQAAGIGLPTDQETMDEMANEIIELESRLAAQGEELSRLREALREVVENVLDWGDYALYERTRAALGGG